MKCCLFFKLEAGSFSSSLLLSKAKIEEIVYVPEKALNMCKSMMKCYLFAFQFIAI